MKIEYLASKLSFFLQIPKNLVDFGSIISASTSISLHVRYLAGWNKTWCYSHQFTHENFRTISHKDIYLQIEIILKDK